MANLMTPTKYSVIILEYPIPGAHVPDIPHIPPHVSPSALAQTSQQPQTSLVKCPENKLNHISVT